MSENVGVFRSRLNTLPIDLKEKIGEVSFQKGMLASSRKKKVIDLLNEYNIQWLEVGTGTNRFIVKYDGYVIKIALDKEGVADNKQEWVMSDLLSPNVAYAHEISKGGHLLVASYAPAFTSQSEMYSYSSTIKRILADWGSKYLLGDVGLTRVNYANWGISFDGRPVCIDYAYIFPAGMDLFKCICGNKNLTFTDSTYSSYKCPKCGHVYEDREIRTKISQTERMKLFESVSGFEMTKEFETFPIDDKYVKVDNNPDAPDPYLSAYKMMGLVDDYVGF